MKHTVTGRVAEEFRLHVQTVRRSKIWFRTDSLKKKDETRCSVVMYWVKAGSGGSRTSAPMGWGVTPSCAERVRGGLISKGSDRGKRAGRTGGCTRAKGVKIRGMKVPLSHIRWRKMKRALRKGPQLRAIPKKVKGASEIALSGERKEVTRKDHEHQKARRGPSRDREELNAEHKKLRDQKKKDTGGL